MSNGKDKYSSRDNRMIVRKLFMDEWDPIGVKGCEGAEDEYDRYVARAYVMLMDDGAGSQEIADYLIDIASNHMGLGLTAQLRQASIKTAEMLIALRSKFLIH